MDLHTILEYYIYLATTKGVSILPSHLENEVFEFSDVDELTDSEREYFVRKVISFQKKKGLDEFFIEDGWDYDHIQYIIPEKEVGSFKDELMEAFKNVIIDKNYSEIRVLSRIQQVPKNPYCIITIELQYNTGNKYNIGSILSLREQIAKNYNIVMTGCGFKWQVYKKDDKKDDYINYLN